MRIEVICTGDEVLTGKTINTNFSFMTQRLEDVGLEVRWGTTVGDDRETLLEAFRVATSRADAVIVNGGLGPTVDDLSQEMAAKAAGVELVLHEEWLTRMEAHFQRRSRVMPANNRKQAMLPLTADILDNPIGTACGFTLPIGKARFFFTPGVPREMRRMIDEQVIPRLLAMSGTSATLYLKRFHSYGIGESRADTLLTGIEAMAPDGTVKLGFRAHYPQLETKLAVRGKDQADIDRKLAPIVAEVRQRLGNFILAEDDQTLEGVILSALAQRGSSVAVAETATGGQIAARLATQPASAGIFRQGSIAPSAEGLRDLLGASATTAEALAKTARERANASHGLAVLLQIDEGPDRVDLGGTVFLAIATEGGIVSREAKMRGGRGWVLQGAVEMGLDCLRRHLFDLPVGEKIDFEIA